MASRSSKPSLPGHVLTERLDGSGFEAMCQESKHTGLSVSSTGLTDDPLEGGRLHVLQPRAGYRFSVDALLLADFARLRPRDRIVDLGSGCGVVAIVLAYRYPEVHVVAVEIQERLAALARENVRRNGLVGRVDVLEADLSSLAGRLPAAAFTHVLTNPPYRSPGTGRLCPHPEEARARHELLTDLAQVLAAARYLLRNGGRMSLIYTADRMAGVLDGMCKHGLEPKRLRLVHPRRGTPARLMLVEGCKGAREGLTVLEPLFIAGEAGEDA